MTNNDYASTMPNRSGGGSSGSAKPTEMGKQASGTGCYPPSCIPPSGKSMPMTIDRTKGVPPDREKAGDTY